MDGAAISNVVSYGLYYLLIIATVVPLCRVHVVDRRWWLILLLLLAIFALNWAWQAYLPALNIWADSIARSLVLLGGGAAVSYIAKLSPEIHQQIKK